MVKDKDLLILSHKLIEKNREAYEKLANENTLSERQGIDVNKYQV